MYVYMVYEVDWSRRVIRQYNNDGFLRFRDDDSTSILIYRYILVE